MIASQLRGLRYGLPLVAALFVLSGAGCGDAGADADDVQAMNPCSARSLPQVSAENPCGTPNPCAAKNPCNPCVGANPCNPCGAKNPCNPCGAKTIDPAKFVQPSNVTLAGTDRAALSARGAELWNDTSLSSNGASCGTCHVGRYAQMQPGFARPYPHPVAMVKQMSGVEAVNAAEMVQFCMVSPMQAQPLAWDSRELAALALYVEDIQGDFELSANPCRMKNPCNPRGAGNPCNPCGGK